MEKTNDFSTLHPHLRFTVEGVQYETDQQYLTGAAIKQFAGISPDVDLYLRVNAPFNDELIENDKEVNLALPGIEGFFTKRALKYYVDGRPFFSKGQYITGEAIKTAAGLSLDVELFLDVPEGWQDQRIGNEDRVNLARPGQERFISKRKTVIIFVNGTRYEYTGRPFLSRKSSNSPMFLRPARGSLSSTITALIKTLREFCPEALSSTLKIT